MRISFLFAAIILTSKGFGQCPLLYLSGSGQNCLGSTLSVTSIDPYAGNGIDKIIWYYNGVAVETDTLTPAGSMKTTYTPTIPGYYTAVITVDDSCSEGGVGITVNPIVTPTISISASATTVTGCAWVTFTASFTNGGSNPSFEWQVNGADSGGFGPEANIQLTNNASVSCIMTSNASCITDSIAVSEPVSITVKQVGPPSIFITASADSICAGTPVRFSAVVANGGANMVYSWRLDSAEVGSNSPVYSSSSLSGNDTLICKVSIDSTCLTGTSNSIGITVFPNPSIPAGQLFTTKAGQPVLLIPVVIGDIGSYLWRPATGLSDTTIKDPTALIAEDMEYELYVVSVNGCKDTGEILVQIDSKVKIPNAFTPNGDGKNDVFRVLAAPLGSRIDQFSVYNRWGQVLYLGQNLVAGDPIGGWDGTYNGRPEPPGTYVYSIKISLQNGAEQVFRGTVELIR